MNSGQTFPKTGFVAIKYAVAKGASRLEIPFVETDCAVDLRLSPTFQLLTFGFLIRLREWLLDAPQ